MREVADVNDLKIVLIRRGWLYDQEHQLWSAGHEGPMTIEEAARREGIKIKGQEKNDDSN